jgi:hypothetical protein
VHLGPNRNRGAAAADRGKGACARGAGQHLWRGGSGGKREGREREEGRKGTIRVGEPHTPQRLTDDSPYGGALTCLAMVASSAARDPWGRGRVRRGGTLRRRAFGRSAVAPRGALPPRPRDPAATGDGRCSVVGRGWDGYGEEVRSAAAPSGDLLPRHEELRRSAPEIPPPPGTGGVVRWGG